LILTRKPYTMDPDLLERALTPRTKAVIPVHIYGHPAAMPSIMAFAQDHDLTVIEDLHKRMEHVSQESLLGHLEISHAL
jgi:dTDP-4-amino-4,6-dideoxygalactose transaminase